MPIVLISVDSTNHNLVDFKEGEIQVDLLLQSSHPGSIAIVDELMKTMNITTNLIIPQLDDRRPDETNIDVEVRLKAVVNMVRGSGVRTAMLVSHHSVFNNWQETAIGDEWQVINM
jgi:hypothetical protein